MPDLTDDQLHRYARHVVLPEVGEDGQLRLLASKVLVVGAGGLGSAALTYLAAAGVGTLGIADDDVVDLSNLQRQIIHRTDAVGAPKVESATATLRSLNPEIIIRPHPIRLDGSSAPTIIKDYDLVIDGSDNFATRYALNDACYLARRPLIMGSLSRFEGQISLFKAYALDTLGAHGPCYRCLFPSPPPPGIAPGCAEAGIFGAIAGIVGTLQASEAIKEILNLGTSLSGRLLLYDGLKSQFTHITVKADPQCSVCGHPS